MNLVREGHSHVQNKRWCFGSSDSLDSCRPNWWCRNLLSILSGIDCFGTAGNSIRSMVPSLRAIRPEYLQQQRKLQNRFLIESAQTEVGAVNV